MSLTPGTRLGVYQITAPLGEGGMGQVWRATDTSLGRQVAIKILPDAFAADPERLARFEREAKTLASLNHPNIAQIYAVGGADGRAEAHPYIAMELVEGEDLSQRIARLRAPGASARQAGMPLDEALPIAKQIAEALEAAHEQGIIHRDLKPANIKVRPDGTVKVLDFGLAKALDEPKGSSPQGLENSPTITTPAMTQAGMILGTAAYMAPEQARGKVVDKRADIWAFGAVLFEMVTGARAFGGEDVTDTIVSVISKEPDWTAVPATVPAAVVTVMRRCLQKDRKQRVRDIGDVSLALEGAFETAAPTPGEAATAPTGPALRRWILAAVSLALVASAATAAIAWMLRPSAPPATVTRFSIALGEGQSFTNTGRNTVAVSPDGTTIVYVANEQLYLRSLSTREARPIAGTNLGAGVLNPVFSPDGRAVAFFSAKDNTLKRIDVNGGAAVTLCPATGLYGMSWDASGIVFGQNPGGILRVSANGGTPEVLVSVKDGEIVSGPQLLPGGEAILFTLATRANSSSPLDWDQAQIVAQRLGAAERRVVMAGASDARALPTGHLVYAVDGVVFGVRFDAQRLEAVGAPTPVVEGVRRGGGTGIAHLDISSTGTLAYVPGPVSSATSALRSLAFVDGAGRVEVVKLKAGAFVAPRISPDGTRVTYGSDDEKDANIWVYLLSGAAAPQKLPGAGARHAPIWVGNERVAFQSEQDNVGGIFWQRADGTGTVERLTTAEAGTSQVPESWSPQSETLLYAVTKDGQMSLRTLSVRDKKDAPFGRAETSEAMDAVFSPDGRWVAYDVAGRIYVAPFPPTDEPREGPEAGGNPFWSGDGKQLFYAVGDGRNQAFGVVTFSATPTPVFGIPSTVPRSGLTSSGPQVRRNYDRDPRSDRILGVLRATSVDQTTGAATEPTIEVVLGWFEELKRLVPVK